MKCENFLLVNHKNTIESFDLNAFSQTKTNLFLKLGSKENHISLKSQITKLISSISNINYSVIEKEDQLDIIYRLTDIYYKIANFDINNQDYCNEICMQLASKDYNTELNLQPYIIKQIDIVLVYGFINLTMKYNPNQRLDYPAFIALIKEIKEENIGIIKEYCNDNSNQSISLQHNNINNHNQYIIPNELLLLLNIFSSIKTIVISMDDCSDVFLLSLLLLIMNYEWLFSNVLSISFNTSCLIIQKELLNSYQSDLNGNHKQKRKKTLTEKSFWKTNKLESHSSSFDWTQVSKLSEHYYKFFTIIPLISHYLLCLPHLQDLTLIIPDTFKEEITDCFKRIKIPIDDSLFNFLQLYLPFQYLLSLSIEFNCLELSSFEIILGIINNNINLKHLSLSLFSKEEESYYYSSIYKTMTNENITPLLSLSSSSITSSSLPSNKNENDNPELNPFAYSLSDYSLIENSQLIQGFERNLKYLFLLLLTKKTLTSLHFELDIPGIISSNDKYYFTIIKSVFNIFILLNNNQTKNLTEIKLISPGLRLDNRKYPLIEQFFDRINLYNKNIRLTSLSIQFQIMALNNLSNVISIYLQYLFIGDLDLDSLKALIFYYKTDTFITQSKLVTLILSLSSTLFNYDSFKTEIIELLQGVYPSNLKEFGLHCSCAIKASDLRGLIDGCNGNQIEKYMFQIKHISQNENEYCTFDYEKYYYYDYSYSLKYTRNKWIVIQVLYSLKVLNKKTFDLVLLLLDRGFVVQKVKRRKQIEISFKL